MNHVDALMQWVIERNPERVTDGVTDTTPLIAERLLTSLQIAELLLFIERRRGCAIDVRALQPGSFADVRTIVATFLSDDLQGDLSGKQR